MKTKFAALALGAATLLSAASAQATEEKNIVVAATEQTQISEAVPASPAAASSYNLFDPSTWSDAAGEVKPGEMVDFDPADPKSWAMIVDPKTHSKVHMTLTNPAYYAKFMTPGYYMKYMDPKTWLSYMDISTYEPLFKVASDPKTASYWMQPGAYMHTMNPAGYMQMADINAYTNMATKVAEGYGVSDTDSVANLFNPFSWMKQFADATSAMTQNTQ